MCAVRHSRHMTDADRRSHATRLAGGAGGPAEHDAAAGTARSSLLHRFCVALGDCCPDNRHCDAMRAYSTELHEWCRRPPAAAATMTRASSVVAAPIDAQQTRQCVDPLEQRAPQPVMRQKTLSVAVDDDDDETGASTRFFHVPPSVYHIQACFVSSSLYTIVSSPFLAFCCLLCPLGRAQTRPSPRCRSRALARRAVSPAALSRALSTAHALTRTAQTSLLPLLLMLLLLPMLLLLSSCVRTSCVCARWWQHCATVRRRRRPN